MKKETILIVWDRIGEYHLARIKACEQLFPSAVYSADLGSSDTLYKWNTIERPDHFILSAKPVEERDIIRRFKHFRRLIKEKKITAVAMGYGRIDYIIFLLYARLQGIKTIVFSESWYPRGGIKDFLKACLLKTIGDHFFVSGQRAYNHFSNGYDISPEKVKPGYSVVDNAHFFNEKSFTERENILLCVARYSPEKNLVFLIRAFLSSAISRDYVLKIVGDGPQKKELEELCAGKPVYLEPWKQYGQLPQIYSGAKLFVLPSRFEPWGLVVNEAMAAGLPVILSESCGCVPDLVEQDKNGWILSSEREEAWIKVFDDIHVHSNETLQEMGKYSQKRIQAFSPQQWARTLQEILT